MLLVPPRATLLVPSTMEPSKPTDIETAHELSPTETGSKRQVALLLLEKVLSAVPVGRVWSQPEYDIAPIWSPSDAETVATALSPVPVPGLTRPQRVATKPEENVRYVSASLVIAWLCPVGSQTTLVMFVAVPPPASSRTSTNSIRSEPETSREAETEVPVAVAVPKSTRAMAMSRDYWEFFSFCDGDSALAAGNGKHDFFLTDFLDRNLLHGFQRGSGKRGHLALLSDFKRHIRRG